MDVIYYCRSCGSLLKRHDNGLICPSKVCEEKRWPLSLSLSKKGECDEEQESRDMAKSISPHQRKARSSHPRREEEH